MSILRPLKAPMVIGAVGETKFSEKSLEVQWPPRTSTVAGKKVKPREFFDLLQYHRPVYKHGGHKGPTQKQRIGMRRQDWRRKYRG